MFLNDVYTSEFLLSSTYCTTVSTLKSGSNNSKMTRIHYPGLNKSLSFTSETIRPFTKVDFGVIFVYITCECSIYGSGGLVAQLCPTL